MFEINGNIRNSIKGIIIRKDKILLTVNRIKNEKFYLLPGGGQHEGELMKDTLKRECLEEIGAKVSVGELKYIREYIKNEDNKKIHQVEIMFICELLEEEVKLTKSKDDFQIGIEWVDLSKLGQINLYPKQLSKVITSTGDFLTPMYLGD